MGLTFYKRATVLSTMVLFMFTVRFSIRNSRKIEAKQNVLPDAVGQKTKTIGTLPSTQTTLETSNATEELWSMSTEDMQPTTEEFIYLVHNETANRTALDCPNVFPNPSKHLLGKIDEKLVNPNENDLKSSVEKIRKTSREGGSWAPHWCNPRQKVGIIIPYRDRMDHLLRLLIYLTPILRRQLLDYRFIVAEQQGNEAFNKGRIMNAAFTVASNMSLDCVIFHDVDIMPQDDRIPYSCPSQPFHMGGRVNTLKYVIWYHNLVGGALAFTMDHYRLVNGYSNLFWGWGGEDDDMGNRILAAGLSIDRPNESIGKYTMLKHKKRHSPKFSRQAKMVHTMLEGGLRRYKYDGLNSPSAWSVVRVTQTDLYYHVIVDVGQMPRDWRA